MTKKMENKGFLGGDWKGNLGMAFRVSKIAIFKKGGTFSRILSDFGGKFLRKSSFRGQILKEKHAKSSFRVSFWHERNPRLGDVFNNCGHACEQFYNWLPPSTGKLHEVNIWRFYIWGWSDWRNAKPQYQTSELAGSTGPYVLTSLWEVCAASDLISRKRELYIRWIQRSVDLCDLAKFWESSCGLNVNKLYINPSCLRMKK